VEYKVIISPPARRDLRSIGQYIARDNPEAAKKFCRNLLLEARTLKIFPDRGLRVARSNARLIVYRTYLIFYEIDTNIGQVKILRFWHSARSQHRLRLREENAEYLIAASATP
jgi:plasmid stabilization system protein ParE